ncbi:hypothetical protein [Streptomyces sp. NRRL F-5123]|uniref:hypothetical protein n=1 Tax=Streptomyces sp. NRRL F-5123 TaxID=1463856 RepID=UPI000A9EAC76|nr:hypothetical protein [Streptomyces sp. NRRL F-5123]
MARPTGMTVTTTSGRAAAAVVLAAALALVGAGCGTQESSGGQQGTPGPASTSPTAGDGTSVGQVVFFSPAPRGPRDGHEVLGSRADAERYAAAFTDGQARAQLTAVARGTDFTRQVLVGWTRPTGCSTATAAALRVSGNQLELHVSQPEPLPECVVAFRVSVVFQVPREHMPARPEFA